MMKRTLPLLLLLLALACAAGCEPKKDTPNANANANANSRSNIGTRQDDPNLNVNANNTIAPALRSKEDKSVAIHIVEDGSGKHQILVSPESVKLLKSKNQKLRFHVFNNTEIDLKEVVITFVTENPMEGSFNIGDIKAGHDKSSATHNIRSTAPDGRYVYGLKAFDNISPDPVAVMNSPQVEIAT